jgi:hypothetical protein
VVSASDIFSLRGRQSLAPMTAINEGLFIGLSSESADQDRIEVSAARSVSADHTLFRVVCLRYWPNKDKSSKSSGPSFLTLSPAAKPAAPREDRPLPAPGDA